MLTITEYKYRAHFLGQPIDALGPVAASKSYTPGAVAANASAFAAGTRLIRVATTVDVRVSLTGVADQDSPPIFANSAVLMVVDGGDVLSYKTI